MLKKRTIPLLAFLVVLLLLLPGEVYARTAQQTAGSLTIESPGSCPNGGCAAGQRLTLNVEFPLSSATQYATVCLYIPTNWVSGDNSLSMDTTGGSTGVGYAASTTNCTAAPTNYTLLGGSLSQALTGMFADKLGFSFRIGKDATSDGSIMARIFESSDGGTTYVQQTVQPNVTIDVTAGHGSSISTVYVANSASGCDGNYPCYIDSDGDETGGIGTGLKDAVDTYDTEYPASVTVLSSYAVKSNTVVVDQPVTLKGINDSTITYAGITCSNPVLDLQSSVTVQDLNITDGTCSSTNRDLIQVSAASGAAVTIASSDLTGGKNAIQSSTDGSLTVRFNRITGNSGYGLYWGSGSGTLSAVANNISANRSGAQADCSSAAGRVVDHNYWGSGRLPSSVATNCTASDAKRLGAEILANTDAPGVQGRLVTVTTSETGYFNDQVWVSFNTTNTAVTEIPLYILNHGYGSTSNVPFASLAESPVTACGNYWDVFTGEGAVTDGATLQAYFDYSLNSTCISTISSTSYCQQSDTALYPLYWFNVAGGTWATTGSTLQSTVCDTTNNRIGVLIDSSGNPNLSDLSYVPFVVGIPPTPTSTPTPTVSLTPTPTETPTPTPSPSGTVTATPTPTTATFTPTITRTPTQTRTLTKTLTGSETVTPTPTGSITETETPTNTKTKTRTPTRTRTRTPTRTPTTYTSTRTRTRTPTDSSGYDGEATSTVYYGYPGTITGTITRTKSGTVTVVGTRTPQVMTSGTLTALAAYPGEISDLTQEPVPYSVESESPVPTGSTTPTAITDTPRPDETMVTGTPPTPTSTPETKSPMRTLFFVSLGLGGMLGFASLLAGGWYLFIRRTIR